MLSAQKSIIKANCSQEPRTEWNVYLSEYSELEQVIIKEKGVHKMSDHDKWKVFKAKSLVTPWALVAIRLSGDVVSGGKGE